MVITAVDRNSDDVDSDEIVRLVNRSYRGESAAQGWASEAQVITGQRLDREMFAEMLAEEHSAMLLMRDEVGGPLIGCVFLAPTTDAAVWHLGMLTVDPSRQADGVGRVLLGDAEQYLRDRGAVRVRMTVIWIRDTLLAWYERRGYRRTGRTEPFPYGNERFGVPTRDDLYFLELEKDLR